jgi:hypothetical protein
MPGGAQPFHRQIRHDPRQIGLGADHLRPVGGRPFDPGVLDRILGIGRGAEDAVCHREQQVAMLVVDALVDVRD